MRIFVFLAALAVLPSVYAGSASVRESRKMTLEFMAAMHSNPKIAQGSKMGRRRLHIEERQRKLRESIMKKARKLSNNQGGYQQSQQSQQQNGGQSYGWQSEYQYQNDYKYGGDYNYNNVQMNDGGSYSNGQWNGQGVNGKYLNNKGYDSSNYEGADGNWGGNWASEYNGDFDMSSRSFKYAGCASIKSFDEYYAMQSTTLDPFKTQTYVTFRLCPADSCNKYSLMGCSKNYGEYVVEMESYLESIMEYYSQRYEEYCEYCLTCDSEVQLEATEVLQQCYFEKTMESMSQNSNSQSSYANSNSNSKNNYDTVYNNGNGLQSSSYQTSDGNRKLYYDYNSANGGQSDNSAGTTYSKSMYDGNGYWSNGEFTEGYWKDGLFYQYDEEIESAIKNCKKNQYEGNYQDYDCSHLNDCDEQNQMDYPPCDSDVCGDYYKYCTELHGNVKNQTTSANTDFMSCTPFESFSFVKEKNVQTVQNGDEEYVKYKYKRYQYYDEEQQGVMFYIGPHCSDDHYHLTLGVFSDENCADYIGDQVSVSKVLGFDFDDTNVFQLPEECLSCDGMTEASGYSGNNQGADKYNDDNFASKQSGYYKSYNADGSASYQYSDEYQQYNQQYGDGNDDQFSGYGGNQKAYGSNANYYSTYVQAPDTDEDGIVAMCSTLYSASAQCNKNLKSYSTYSQYMTRYELDIEARYCTFINNINSGTFDSEGHIITDGNIFNAKTWRRQKYGSRMTVGQGVLLTFSVLVCASLATVIVYFHKLIRTRRESPWRPQKEINLEGMTIVGPPIGAQLGGSPRSYGADNASPYAAGNAPLIY
ncbi:unnamed protein product [Cylindrotheca closterium]|uniref:Uncharacterized protein n=1 Tax=Cylindrotheca closterium TaxID=2856 RepID=A0AAD2CKE6_9STRA|nr:unnamed protein product [Cylindrotheca closterium]